MRLIFEKKRLAPGLILAAASLLFLKCRSHPPAPVRAAFFFWKTELALSGFEQDRLKSLAINKLYARLFDIDLDSDGGRPVPVAVASTENAGRDFAGFELTGCVFITSRVFEKGNSDPGLLAEKTASLLADLAPKLPGGLPKNLLLDCDWTAGSRDGYFLFLKKLAEKLPSHRLSATIRLHQFKRPEETGVPPVASGLLMCYNTGELTDWQTENSILDSVELKKYLRGGGVLKGRYPLPLDVALPVFGWGVVFRDGRFFKLIHGLEASQLVDHQRFGPISASRLSVKKETLLEGIYLHPGDLIRLEKPSPELVELAAAELRRLGLPNSDEPTVGFYHLDSAAVAGLPGGFVKRVLER